MTAIHSSLTVFGLTLLLTTAAQAQRATLGVGDIEINEAVRQSALKDGNENSLRRVTQSMEDQLISQINGSRKFQVVARSDLKKLLEEQDLVASGLVAPDSEGAAEQFTVSGIEYMLVVGIDDYQDYTETATFDALDSKATRRIIRLSAIGKIYDTTSGKLLESASIQLEEQQLLEKATFASQSGDLTDKLLVGMARKMAERLADRVTNVIFPAKILTKRGSSVMINRGDGTDVETGQIWDVFEVGDALIDPDTGEQLGQAEFKVGEIKITRINPKFSQAEIVEDNGIEQGAIARRAKRETAATSGGEGE